MQIFKQKQSFFDFLFRRPVEQIVKFYNPLEIRPDSTIKLPLDGETTEFRLAEVCEYKRILNGNEHFFTDYTLVSRGIGKEKQRVTLRVTPNEDASPEDGYEYTCLLLRLDDKLEYSEDIQNTLIEADRNREWVITLEGPEDGLAGGETQTIVYPRLNGFKFPFDVEVACVKDQNKNKCLDYNEASTSRLKYWDFSRETEDGEEFFFVEMDGKTGYVTMYRGNELNPSSVEVI